MTDESKTKETETKEKSFMDGWTLSEREQMIKEWYYKKGHNKGFEEGLRKGATETGMNWMGCMFLIAILSGLVALCSHGCAKTNVAETTPRFPDEVFLNVVEPEVKIWPDSIEIRAEVKDLFGADYNVNYTYFKETKESGIEAMLSLDPIGATEKLPSKIYINKFGKIEKVSIWGVGEYECSYNYEEMSGSLCKHAGLMYFQICEVQMTTSNKEMTCKEMVEEILLKEPAEWL